MKFVPWIAQQAAEKTGCIDSKYNPSKVPDEPLSSITVVSPSGDKCAVSYFVEGSVCIIVGLKQVGNVIG